jgi:hypothetical protein
MILAQTSEFMVGKAHRAAATKRAGMSGHPVGAVAVWSAPARTTVRREVA